MTELEALELLAQLSGAAERVRNLELQLIAPLTGDDAQWWPENKRREQVAAMEIARANWRVAVEALDAARTDA